MAATQVDVPHPSLSRRLPRWLEFWIALSAAVALASTGAVIFYALGKLASEVNNTDLGLTRQSARAAITAFETRLRDNLQDYANWDDAAIKLYNEPDADFVSDILKDVTDTGLVFDTAFLIDENKNDLASYKEGKPLAAASKFFVGPPLQVLMGMLDGKAEAYQSAGGLIKTRDGVAAVAVGLVIPYSKDVKLPEGQKRFLLIAKHLTPANVERLRNEFVIPGLDLNGASDIEYSVPLIDPLGATIGSLRWAKRSPGTAALKKISPAVWLILALLTAVTGGIIIFACINVRHAYRSRLRAEHAATHDFLTGLPNRAALKAIFEEKGNSNNLETHNSAVVFFDLDGFKQVNDAYGHDVGDRLLRACGAGFQYLIGSKGTLGRVGGDEFVVLLSGSNAHAAALELASQFIAFLREPFLFDGREIKVSTSVGIACGHARQTTMEELLRRADIAMYQAKKDGGNRVASYDADIDLKLRERVELAAALRDAIKAGQISVAYQVVVDANSQQVCAVEALARWTLPDGTAMAPDVFIPLAEENGLIDSLGNQVLRQACLDAVGWDDIVLSVNVSPVQFHNPRFDDIVSNVLVETGFPPGRLDLELTERHLVSDPDQAFRTMLRLRDHGISMSLDDFGTGYSSIGYLKRFKFDRLKLDQSICSEVVTDENAQKMIQGTIAIASSLGLQVTAEGVESAQQLQFLRLAGCRWLQGYYFGEPASAQVFQEMLDAYREDMRASA
jgi:diguanylate cyclase (GGDEF)-like protein